MHACIVTWMCAKRMQHPECRKLRTEELRGAETEKRRYRRKLNRLTIEAR